MDKSARDYEQVAYPSNAITVSSPDRLRSAGLLQGWRGPDAETASILEIGCGNGNNLIAIAVAAPGTRCVGFDLSPSAIAAGQAQIERAGATNVTLSVGDIMTWPRDGGKFDYIICHGVFSWVPDFVRQPLLELIGTLLAPGGAAYMSYDALPAAAGKLAINRFIRENTEHISDTQERVQRAAELIALLARMQRKGGFINPMFDMLKREFSKFNAAYFFHDWLEENYRPIAIGDLMAAMGKAGLKFAGDARLIDLYVEDLEPEALALIDAHRDNPGRCHELLDMLHGDRIFHEDIFVRIDAPPPPEPDPWSMLTFALIGDRVETGDASTVKFSVSEHTSFEAPADSHQAKILEFLLSISPNEVSAFEIAEQTGLDIDIVRETMPILCVGLFVDAHASPRNFVTTPGSKPLASRFVRSTIRSSKATSTLRHANTEPANDFVRLLLILCDGSRTREDLAAALSEAVKQQVPVAHVENLLNELAEQPLFEA